MRKSHSFAKILDKKCIIKETKKTITLNKDSFYLLLKEYKDEINFLKTDILFLESLKPQVEALKKSSVFWRIAYNNLNKKFKMDEVKMELENINFIATKILKEYLNVKEYGGSDGDN